MMYRELHLLALGFQMMAAGVIAEASRFQATAGLSTAPSQGVIPRGPTFYANLPRAGQLPVNNGRAGSIGLAICENGSLLIGWEDDGVGYSDYKAVWSMHRPEGIKVLPDAEIRTLTEDTQPFHQPFRSFYRGDNTAIPAGTAWGPKLKANRFGGGFGFGATAFAVWQEIPELVDINFQSSDESEGDFPMLQLFSCEAQTTSPAFGGVTDLEADPPGNMRISDWDFLSNGDIVIATESRQTSDLVDRFGGTERGIHVLLRIHGPGGVPRTPLFLASQDPVPTEAWHGIGVTRTGFALRFLKAGRVMVRMFNNSGEPQTGDIDLASLAGNEIHAAGGRGDNAGFQGNGDDAYVAASVADGAPSSPVAVAVINHDGTLRWSRLAADDYPLALSPRVDAAIDADGRVCVAFSGGAEGAPPTFLQVIARMFDRQGDPLTASFRISESELHEDSSEASVHPRIAWRGSLLAVAWESRNAPGTVNRTIAARAFSTPLSSPKAIAATLPSPIFYANSLDPETPTDNNGATKDLQLAVAADGSVLLGWQDRGGSPADHGAVWALFDRTGTSALKPLVVTSSQPERTPFVSRLRSFYRDDGSVIGGWPVQHPRPRTSRFSLQRGFGASTVMLGAELPQLDPLILQETDEQRAEIPVLQMLHPDGSPATRVFAGVSEADADSPGGIQLGDWTFLSDGNLVLALESEQTLDLTNRFGGSVPGSHIAIRIIKKSGSEVRPLSLPTADAVSSAGPVELAASRDAFAIRFSQAGRQKLVLLNNDGTARTPPIDLLTNLFPGTDEPPVKECLGLDSTSTHFLAVAGISNALGQIRLRAGCFDRDGALLWVADPLRNLDFARCLDADIAAGPLGEAAVVFTLANPDGTTQVGARLLRTNGLSLSPVFGLSEAAYEPEHRWIARNSQVAWQNSSLVFAWESHDAGGSLGFRAAFRRFELGDAPTDLRISW
ncbi:MAG: hypothetical protein FJ405_13510, partial [Verrucomicrobia bacterium]|nr:hypothetical protein [Verrucomicrobiota bacterium]